MDTLTPAERSDRMRRIRNKNTKPELLVRSLVFSMGYRYRLHMKHLPGHPDLTFVGRRKVIFVNGCFWHGHPECNQWRLPKSNIDFWAEKIKKNRMRDEKNRMALEKDGWSVLTLWECEIRSSNTLAEKIAEFLEK